MFWTNRPPGCRTLRPLWRKQIKNSYYRFWPQDAGAQHAACLLDADRATLFGENTFGRAGIQKQIPLDSGGGLVLTVSRYLTPKGVAINGKGLTPKTLVRNPESPELIGAPGKDPILDKALESLKVGALKAAA